MFRVLSCAVLFVSLFAVTQPADAVLPIGCVRYRTQCVFPTYYQTPVYYQPVYYSVPVYYQRPVYVYPQPVYVVPTYCPPTIYYGW